MRKKIFAACFLFLCSLLLSAHLMDAYQHRADQASCIAPEQGSLAAELPSDAGIQIAPPSNWIKYILKVSATEVREEEEHLYGRTSFKNKINGSNQLTAIYFSGVHGSRSWKEPLRSFAKTSFCTSLRLYLVFRVFRI